MESNIKLGKIFGIEIGINYSWFIIFILITLTLWNNFKDTNLGWSSSWYLIMALSTSFLFFLSILFHEMAHSLLALARRLPVHSITLFIFGGVSRIEKEATSAATEFWVGVAGPLSSVFLAGFFFILSILVGDPHSPLGAMTGWLAYINMILAVFNMIPGFPLDGGRVLRALIWAISGSLDKATRIASTIGKGIAYLLILAGILIAIKLRLYIEGLWLAFIGWFLLDASKSIRQTMIIERALKGARARDVMSVDVPTVPGNVTLVEFFENYLMQHGRGCFVVVDHQRLMGLMTSRELKAVERDKWQDALVHDVMKPFETMRVVEPNADIRNVVEIMENRHVNQVPVVLDGRLEGLIRREDVLRFIGTRAEFDR